MSMHSSLSSKGKNKRSRSVLKRFERLKEMLVQEKWKLGDSVFGLPKFKVVRWKVKKAKKAVEEETAAQGTTEGAAGTEKAPEKKEEGRGKK